MINKYITKEKNFISVVAYLHNSEQHVGNFLKLLDNLLSEKFESYEFVLVNDYSCDKTINIIREIRNNINGKVTIVNLAWKHGIELAMLSGVDIAIGDFVIEFDSVNIDFDTKEVWKVYEKCLTGYDVVSATPNKNIKITSKVFYKFLNKLSYRKMDLTTETFRIISRRALNRVLKSKETLRYRKALYHYSGFETINLRYEATNNSKFDDGISLSEKVNLCSNILIGFSDIGARLTNLISIIFFIMSILMGAYAINSYLTLSYIEPGWTTIMVFLSFGFTGIFLILSILAKYLIILLTEVQNKPKYVFKSIDKL